MAIQREFQIGLVLAGAISAGAYTAGVMDFLLEALEAWDRAKNDRPDAVPDHEVRIRAMSGSSAGAMTAAIVMRALASKVIPVTDVNAPPDQPADSPMQQRGAFKNPFYAAWVQSIDIKHLLGSKDLEAKSAQVLSMLDSTVLSYIGGNVLDATGVLRAAPPGYAREPVDLFLTTTNLRGVPYGFDFAGEVTGYKHMMTTYADHMRFTLAWPTPAVPLASEAIDTKALPLEPSRLAPSGTWAIMMEAALASGAFPIGLAPRLLKRHATDYDRRAWTVPEQGCLKTVPERPGEEPRPVKASLREQQAVVSAAIDPRALQCECTTTRQILPAWPNGISSTDPAKPGADPAYVYEYWNVDGGLMNNEPLELVRKVLSGDGRNPRSGLEANRAVIMIDPFPNTSDVSKDYDKGISLLGIVTRMFGALKEQARFKTDELVLATDPEVYSRFVISPIYIDAAGKTTNPAIASAVMGGFGGFFAESFRRHDFQLGRRNCQRFLQRYFVLPLANPLFESWRDNEELKRKFTFMDTDAQGRPTPFASIVPLVERLNPDLDPRAEIPLPARSNRTDVDLATLRTQVCDRIDAVIPRLIASLPAVGLRVSLQILWCAAKILGQRRKIVELLMAKVERELSTLG